MNAKVIKELLGFIARSNVSEVVIKTDELELSVKKGTTTSVAAPSTATQEEDLGAEIPAVVDAPKPVATPPPSSSKTLNAPMIGTFYTSKNPESPPFI